MIRAFRIFDIVWGSRGKKLPTVLWVTIPSTTMPSAVANAIAYQVRNAFNLVPETWEEEELQGPFSEDGYEAGNGFLYRWPTPNTRDLRIIQDGKPYMTLYPAHECYKLIYALFVARSVE